MANKGSFLATGQYLSVGDYLVSDNGEFFAVMQNDGNFVLYRGSGPSDNQGYIWSISHTSLPTGQYFAIMQSDGNFVVYHGSDPAHQGAPIWATNTSGQSFVYAIMQSDGNFVLYRGSGPGDIQGFVWATNTPWATQPHRVTTGDRLTAGQWLATGDHLVSGNGQYVAKMQDDGNFVVAQVSPDQALWTSNTVRGHGQYVAKMQDDGNFVVAQVSPDQALWTSNTVRGHGQYVAIMQGDGNFVVYQGSDPAHQGTPIWATNTSWVSHRVTTGSSLTADDWMGTNDYLLSSNQLFAAIMQSDGNFVLYYTTYSTSPTVRPRPDTSRPYWASNTNRSQGQYIAVYKEDGHFILHNGPASGEEKDLTSYWSSSWYGGSRNQNAPLQAIMQDDGNFVLYQRDASGQQQPYWWCIPQTPLLPPTGRAANRVTGRSFLREGEELDAQDCLVSSNGLYFAVMQADGNFVLYHTTDAVNASPDFSRPYSVVNPAYSAGLPQNQCFATMQTDGNFVLYYRDSGRQNAYWATNTAHSSQGQYIAVLHDNGNFAVYQGSDPTQVGALTPLWQSNTVVDPSALTLTILSGNNQNVKAILQAGHYVSLAPLVVQVKQQNGQPAPHVPVTFGLSGTSGDMDMQFTPGQQSQGPITLSTDPNGIASEQASVNCYSSGGCVFTINAQVANGGSVSFNVGITSS
jgi:hypothetical protein